MNREKLLARLNAPWQDFRLSFAGLTDDEMATAGVTDDWSVRDIAGHVTTWEAEALRWLPVLIEGKRAGRYGDIDRFNDEQRRLKSALSSAEVVDELAKTHARLVAYLNELPEALFEGERPLRRRLRLDTYSHYPIHTNAIGEWRQRQSF